VERVKFKIKVSFWIFIVAAIVFKQGYFAATYTIAMIAHELAHYVVAGKLFYHCKEIQLSIFGAVLYGDFQDITANDRIKIALAGPVCNLIVCLACLAVWWILPDSYYYTEDFVVSNLGMAFVNLLPCYPLDGGRILTGILERKLTSHKSVELTKKITVVLSVILFGVFVYSLFDKSNMFSLGLFAVCLMSGVFVNGNECYVKTAFATNKSRFLKKGMEKKTLVFNYNNLLSDVVKRMQGNFLYCLEVVNDEMQVISRYGIAELEQVVLSTPLDTPLKNLRKY